MNSEKYRLAVSENLDIIHFRMNNLLKGIDLDDIEPILLRCDATGELPDWFSYLKVEKGLPYGDGKTIGSIVEKLLVCVIEKYVLYGEVELGINPARGVDIPLLELGIKSPSENMCTSEPFFSAYERLLGNEYDAIILLTNLQSVKSKRPIPLQVEKIRYLTKSEIADKHLCETARKLRDIFFSDKGALSSLIEFLAYVNQSDWEGTRILKLINEVIIQKKSYSSVINDINTNFNTTNALRRAKNKPLLDDESYERLNNIGKISPIEQGIIKAANDWMIFNQKDNGRCPNENEWNRFMASPLNGKITMSFALQWRYNFSSIFK